MDQYIDRLNTIEKGRNLWIPSSSLGGLLISLIESSSLHTMANNNGEEIQCQSSQEVSGMALAIVLEWFKEKRGFSKKNSCSIKIPWISYFSSTPWDIFIVSIHGKIQMVHNVNKGPFWALPSPWPTLKLDFTQIRVSNHVGSQTRTGWEAENIHKCVIHEKCTDLLVYSHASCAQCTLRVVLAYALCALCICFLWWIYAL